MALHAPLAQPPLPFAAAPLHHRTMATRSARATGSTARTRLFAAPGSTIVPDAAKEDALAKARRNVDAARRAGKPVDKRDEALVRDADQAEKDRKEAARKQDAADAEAKAAAKRNAREARLRAHAHDVLPPFACSPVAHCPHQATLAQCPEFVMAMERFYLFTRVS